MPKTGQNLENASPTLAQSPALRDTSNVTTQAPKRRVKVDHGRQQSEQTA